MKAIIIPADKAYLYRQVDVEHWWGVDAVELKDGTFFISEDDYRKLPENLQVTRMDPASKKESEILVKQEMSKLPIKDLSKSGYKEPEDNFGVGDKEK
jgi:hypothetical protein